MSKLETERKIGVPEAGQLRTFLQWSKVPHGLDILLKVRVLRGVDVKDAVRALMRAAVTFTTEQQAPTDWLPAMLEEELRWRDEIATERLDDEEPT